MPVDPYANFIAQFVRKRETFDEVCEKQRTGQNFRGVSLDGSRKANSERAHFASMVHESFSDLIERINKTKRHEEKMMKKLSDTKSTEDKNQSVGENKNEKTVPKLDGPSLEKRIKKEEVIEID